MFTLCVLVVLYSIVFYAVVSVYLEGKKIREEEQQQAKPLTFVFDSSMSTSYIYKTTVRMGNWVRLIPLVVVALLVLRQHL